MRGKRRSVLRQRGLHERPDVYGRHLSASVHAVSYRCDLPNGRLRLPRDRDPMQQRLHRHEQRRKQLRRLREGLHSSRELHPRNVQLSERLRAMRERLHGPGHRQRELRLLWHDLRRHVHPR